MKMSVYDVRESCTEVTCNWVISIKDLRQRKPVWREILQHSTRKRRLEQAIVCIKSKVMKKTPKRKLGIEVTQRVRNQFTRLYSEPWIRDVWQGQAEHAAKLTVARTEPTRYMHTARLVACWQRTNTPWTHVVMISLYSSCSWLLPYLKYPTSNNNTYPSQTQVQGPAWLQPA